MKWTLCLLPCLFCLACAGKPLRSGVCEPTKIDSNGVPCWVNNRPVKGIVQNMSQHLDPNKTHDILFKKMILELAVQTEGLDVSEDVIVKKQTQVSNNNVRSSAKVITLATVKTTNGSTNVKAKIIDEWQHPSTKKLYMWIELVN